MGAVATAVLAALVLVLGVPGVSPAARSQVGSASDAEAALAAARQDRASAEERLAALTAQRDAALGEIRRLDAGAEVLTRDLAAARKAVREYAIAAYIDGGQGELLSASLNADQRSALAWRTNLVAGQTVSSAEAVDNYVALKGANEPERVAAARELDRLEAAVEEASNDLIQASAFERDAEHALADIQAAERAAAEAARAEEARRVAAAAAADAASSAATTASPSISSAPRNTAPAPTRAPAATQPSSSGSMGSPTAAESATLSRIRACESGGNYSIVSSSGTYRGAYQFDHRTWAGVGGSGDPAAASAAEQDYRALLLLRQRGTRPWPSCG